MAQFNSSCEHPAPGAFPESDGGTRFAVWAPHAETVHVEIYAPDAKTITRRVALQPLNQDRFHPGYFSGSVADVPPGTLYTFRLSSADRTISRPDPAARRQPLGVHAPSEVIAPIARTHATRFEATPVAMHHTGKARSGGQYLALPLREWIFYEIHPGAFSPEGNLRSAEKYLPELKALGVNAIEIMPIAHFPGKHNWGYDGVYPFAVHNAYGRPEDVLHFVQSCHELQLSVCLDVVYNHLGPEGNYLRDFGPYFTDRYHTPWGEALNFDGAGSDAVRHYFIENALMWLRDFEMDALRLDAVHAIADESAYPFLSELSDRVDSLARTLNRPLYLIAESDRNDPGALRPAPSGQGLHATWADDFHHCVHSLLTGEQNGYYVDFAAGSTEQLLKAYTEGFVFTGQYSRYRQRRHGRPTQDLTDQQFVICIQNHDQVGNRMLGERLSALVSPEALKLAAAMLLLAPFPPLLFMGEEYAETAPFLYFVDHGDPDLREAVRAGRRAEFAQFGWQTHPPDPDDPQTFERSRLNRALKERATHADVYAHYRTLIGLRKELLRCDDFDRKHLRAFYRDAGVLALYSGTDRLMIFNTGAQPAQVPLPTGMWRVLYDNLAIDPEPTVAHTHQTDNLSEDNQNKVDQFDERSTLSSERNDPITGRIILAAEDGADRTTRVLELAAHQALLLRSTLFETDRKHNG